MKRHYLSALLIWANFFAATTAARAQGTGPAPKSPSSLASVTDIICPLFARDSAIQVTLTANLRVLLRDRGDVRAEHPVLLTYADDRQQPVVLPLAATVRGNFRRNATNCSFPPLLLNFPKKKARNTLFDDQNKLKLVTHCQTEEYVVREYLVYKLYNLLTDVSFRARLARVTYADSLGKRTPETHWAFLLEDEGAMAKRNGGNVYKQKQTNAGYVDSLGMATVAVFEYLIGNTDWSVPFLHNIRLLSLSAHSDPFPVPYDFDHAGIVEANYALPAEHLAIESVRQRLYRGLPYPIAIFQKVFDRFNQVRPQVYALYANDARLGPAYVKRTLRYLDDFYEIINKPALVRSEFLGSNRPGVVMKGPKKINTQ